jgi:catechol 2,3-dioxygenase-like lactoylglutathione lyase family enzyme
MEKARRFFTDWGMKKVRQGRAGTVFETLAGSEVALLPPSSRTLPPPARPGMNFREMVWGVSSRGHLAKIGKELEKDRDVTVDADGTLHCLDPNGLGVGFGLWSPRKNVGAPRTPINSYERQERIDAVSTFYERARPIRIGHIGFVLPELESAETFYKDRLGFWVSDRYNGHSGLFLRCAARSQHHNLFLIAGKNNALRFHHAAFEVRDIHEVFGGGVYFDRRGWETEVGPGRHPISSAYFWYFRNPCEGAVEYFTDSDYVTEDWKPHNFTVNRFSEWHLVDGIPQAEAVMERPLARVAGKG